MVSTTRAPDVQTAGTFTQQSILQRVLLSCGVVASAFYIVAYDVIAASLCTPAMTVYLDQSASFPRPTRQRETSSSRSCSCSNCS